jgi:large subunit ribosomal protein L21
MLNLGPNFRILDKGKKMFAIIKSGGKQYRVQQGDVLDVEKLPAGAGEKFHFSQVLLIADDKETLIGMPFVEKALVRAEVIEDFKDGKVIVFKKKRRKQFRRTRGHRQQLTRVRVEKIIPDVTALAAEEIVAAEKTSAGVAPTGRKETGTMPPRVEEKVQVPPKKKADRPEKLEAARAAAKPEKQERAARAKTKTPARVSEKKKTK